MKKPFVVPGFDLLVSPRWRDYDLLDSGAGQKLERFGAYTFVRPEAQAIWAPALPTSRWQTADAVFIPSGEESGGHWKERSSLPQYWDMEYPLATVPSPLKFQIMTTPGRHLGVFPECAVHWDWIAERLAAASQAGTSPNVLNLFGYTGLASLAAAAAGARVTHVDASKKTVAWARHNQALSTLAERPIRWIIDDALKFVQREARRGVQYDGILLDPPKFGRGPKGEVWEVYRSLPELLTACRTVLSPTPIFVVLTVYAVRLPAIHAAAALDQVLGGLAGRLECGELVTREKSAGRLLSQAVYARWAASGA